MFFTYSEEEEEEEEEMSLSPVKSEDSDFLLGRVSDGITDG
jgi:hypothetical protein